MSVVERPTASATPAEDHPEAGRVSVCDVLLLRGLRWVDDGSHIIVSTECEVRGEGEDLQAAVEDFVDGAMELYHHLTEVLRAADETEHEREVHVLLSERFSEIFVAIEAFLDEQEQQKAPRFRRRPQLKRRHDWQPTHRSRSAELLPA